MLNSQPLGFYSPSQLVQDARRHAEARRSDVMHSEVDCTLEGLPHPPAARRGLRMISGLKWKSAHRVGATRAGAMRDPAVGEYVREQPPAPEGEEVTFDYASLGLTLRSHPMKPLRPRIAARQLLTSANLEQAPDRRLVHCCGIVTLRQQPETANGTAFTSLDDETGVVQVIVAARCPAQGNSVSAAPGARDLAARG
jgi:error-prone DNA polymerase